MQYLKYSEGGEYEEITNDSSQNRYVECVLLVNLAFGKVRRKLLFVLFL